MSSARLAAGTTLSINDEVIGDLTHISAVGGGNAEIIAVTTHDSPQRYGEGLQGLRSFGELQFAGAASSVETFSTMELVQFAVTYPGQTAWRGAGFITNVTTGAAIDEMIPFAITARICIICSGVVEAVYSVDAADYTATFTDSSTGDITSWLWDFGDGTGLYYTPQGGYQIDDLAAWLLDDTQGRGDAYSYGSAVTHEYAGGTPAGDGDWTVSGAGDDSYNGTYIEDGTYNLYPAYKKAGGTEETYTTTLTVSDLCGSDDDTHDITVGSESEERWLYKAYIITDMEYIWVFNTERIDVDVLGLDVAYYSSSTVGGTWYLANGDSPAPTVTAT